MSQIQFKLFFPGEAPTINTFPKESILVVAKSYHTDQNGNQTISIMVKDIDKSFEYPVRPVDDLEQIYADINDALKSSNDQAFAFYFAEKEDMRPSF